MKLQSLLPLKELKNNQLTAHFYKLFIPLY